VLSPDPPGNAILTSTLSRLRRANVRAACSPASFVSGADPEELLKPQDLGCPDFSQIEADALDLRQNI
jgi:hypothetical protein